MTFDPIGPTGSITMNLQPKAIQELFTVDYGRMNATLGVEIPLTNGVNQTTIPYGYIDPLTEALKAVDPTATELGSGADGTQIWKITHNGVDTHAIHVHMFNMQVINRVGWDGAIRPPDANELGWKETVRMNPLEDIIVAIRPIIIKVPFQLPNSIRLMDVTRIAGTSGTQFFNVDPTGNPVAVVNDMVNFGWEYVWHCHLLGHEENDMMRPLSIGMPVQAPANLVATRIGNGANRRVVLTWTDNSTNETNWLLQRGTTSTGPWTTLATLTSAAGPATGGSATYTNPIGNTNTTYYYQVFAVNNIGATQTSGFTAPVPGYSMLTLTSAPAGPVVPGGLLPPPAPANVAATAARVGNSPFDTVTLTWSAVAGATGYTIQMSTNVGFVGFGVVTSNVGAVTTFTSGNILRISGARSPEDSGIQRRGRVRVDERHSVPQNPTVA